MLANLENLEVDTGLEKCQFSFQSPKRAMPKNVQTTIPFFSAIPFALEESSSEPRSFRKILGLGQDLTLFVNLHTQPGATEHLFQ